MKNKVIIIFTSKSAFSGASKQLNSFEGLENFTCQYGGAQKWIKIITDKIIDNEGFSDWSNVNIVLIEDKKYENESKTHFTNIVTSLITAKEEIYCVLHKFPEESEISKSNKVIIECISNKKNKKCFFLPQHHVKDSIYFSELLSILECVQEKKEFNSYLEQIIKKFPDHLLEAKLIINKYLHIYLREKEVEKQSSKKNDAYSFVIGKINKKIPAFKSDSLPDEEKKKFAEFEKWKKENGNSFDYLAIEALNLFAP